MASIEVYAFCKIAEHPDPESGGANKGDIVSFHPGDYIFSDEEINMYLPILINLDVPCGGDFCKVHRKCDNECIHYTKGITKKTCGEFDKTLCYKFKAKCGFECEYYDVDLCDVTKYTRAIWSAGDIEAKIIPRAVTKHRYKIDRSTFITPTEDVIISKPTKTAAEKTLILDIVRARKQLKSIIVDKSG